MSDLTTKRVITLVMSVMISIPIFTVGTYTSDYSSCESGLKTLYRYSQTNKNNNTRAYELGVSTGNFKAFEIANRTYVEAHKVKVIKP